VHDQLEKATASLQEDPENQAFQQRHGDLRIKPQQVEDRKVEGKKIRTRIRWKLKGDMVSKEFFKAIKEKSASTAITGLRNKDGVLVKDRAGLEAICQEYYADLYRSPPKNHETEAAVALILDTLEDKLSRLAKTRLARPLTEMELLQAAKEMATSKSPGPDGYAIEFYISMWLTIGPEFIEMVNQLMMRGQLPHGMNKGLIVLLFKGGDKELLTNWRPVTLINVAYKIVAKALQKRIQPIMSEIIHEDQTSFLPMRYILDNVLLQHEAIEWARESRQEMLLLKLDF
jgi:hypothetical protein